MSYNILVGGRLQGWHAEGGNPDGEYRTAMICGIHGDVALMGINDASCDRQAEAGPFAIGFRAIKRLKNMRQHIWRDAAASIDYLYDHGF